MKISEVVLQVSENGDLHIASELLQEMGLLAGVRGKPEDLHPH